MIFDPNNRVLYASDGTFIKNVDCPMALSVEDLGTLPASSRDRHCFYCEKTIHGIDSSTDEEVQAAVAEDANLCVFATPAAKHVIFLARIGVPSLAARQAAEYEGLTTVRTARTLPAMAAAHSRGLRVHIQPTGTASSIGPKYIVYQHLVTGEVWWSGDFRREWPPGPSEEWNLVATWFHHRLDQTFPLAAYLLPSDVKAGQRVFLEDLIEDVGISYWNQGDSDRLLSSVAVWTGTEFQLEFREIPSLAVG